MGASRGWAGPSGCIQSFSGLFIVLTTNLTQAQSRSPNSCRDLAKGGQVSVDGAEGPPLYLPPGSQLRQLWWGLPGPPVQQLWPFRPLPQPLCSQGNETRKCEKLLVSAKRGFSLSWAFLVPPLKQRCGAGFVSCGLASGFFLASGFDAATLSRKADEQLKAVARCCSFIHTHAKSLDLL